MEDHTTYKPQMKITGLVLDCDDPTALADFYQRLFGWEQFPSGEGWAALKDTSSPLILAFQQVEGYRKPVWPWREGEQAQMLHMDIHVDNLDQAVAFAVQCGAAIAKEQFYDTSTVMIDPAGHPFCLDSEKIE